MAVCSEVSSLRSAEEGVVGCLEAADLRRFLDDSCALGAIPQGVKKDFATLDPEAVPRPLMVRYLLLHVYEWLEANPRLYERWLKVLGRYVSSQVVHKVREQYSGNEAGSSLVGGGSHVGTNFLLEKHVEVLTEVLAGHSSQWHNVGMALRLPRNVLVDIARTYGQYGSNFCLNNCFMNG